MPPLLSLDDFKMTPLSKTEDGIHLKWQHDVDITHLATLVFNVSAHTSDADSQKPVLKASI